MKRAMVLVFFSLLLAGMTWANDADQWRSVGPMERYAFIAGVASGIYVALPADQELVDRAAFVLESAEQLLVLMDAFYADPGNADRPFCEAVAWAISVKLSSEKK